MFLHLPSICWAQQMYYSNELKDQKHENTTMQFPAIGRQCLHSQPTCQVSSKHWGNILWEIRLTDSRTDTLTPQSKTQCYHKFREVSWSKKKSFGNHLFADGDTPGKFTNNPVGATDMWVWGLSDSTTENSKGGKQIVRAEGEDLSWSMKRGWRKESPWKRGD